MNSTQIIKELVNLESNLDIFKVEEVKRDGKLVTIYSKFIYR